MTVAFQANAIRTYFGNGSEFGVRMVYATEENPLGTAGSVRNAMDELHEPFLVISGDVLTDIDLAADRRLPPGTQGAGHHRPQGHGEPARVRHRHHPGGRLHRAFPGEAVVGSGLLRHHQHRASTCSSRRSSTTSSPDKPVDFSADVFPRLLDDGMPLFGYVADGYWEDVGTLDAYIKAHQDVLDAQVALDIPGFRLGDGIWLGEGSEIDPAATVDGPAIIGDYCRVEAGARLAEYTVLGSNVRVGPDASSSARSCTTTSTWVPACGCAARWSAGPATCAGALAWRRASSSATSASSASTR